MVSAYPDRTSPVLRGAYVLEHITGDATLRCRRLTLKPCLKTGQANSQKP